MRLYGLLRGQACICVQNMWQARGSRAMLPWEILILDPFIRCKLVESGIVFAQTYFIIHCVIKLLIYM